jgi:Zn-dependent protease with chaperone function
MIEMLPVHPLRGLSARGVIGLSLSLDVSALVGFQLLVAASRTSRARYALRSVVDLIGISWRGEALVVDFPEPAAYFLPGDGGRVVISSGLAQCADAMVIEAIVRHEHAHRIEHHATVALTSTSLTSYFNFVPWVRLSAYAIPQLCEFAADDAASRATSTDVLRRALLLVVGNKSTPACAFGMGALEVSNRLERLDQSGGLWVVPAMSSLALAFLMAGLALMNFVA